MSIENQIESLISVEEGVEKRSVIFPKKLLDKVLTSFKKRVGAMGGHGDLSRAVRYFLARGVIDWERGHGSEMSGNAPSPVGTAITKEEIMAKMKRRGSAPGPERLKDKGAGTPRPERKL